MSALIAVLAVVVSPMIGRFAEKRAATWTADSGLPVPVDFTYVMYPNPAGAGVYDRPDGSRVGTLGRAMANTYEEATAESWIRVTEKQGGLGWVRRDELVFDAAPESRAKLIAALEERFAPDDDDGQWLSCVVRDGGPGGVVVTVRRPSGGGSIVCEYVVREGIASPQWMRRAGRTESGLEMPLVMGSCVVWIIAGVATGTSLYVWLNRRWRRRTGGARAAPAS